MKRFAGAAGLALALTATVGVIGQSEALPTGSAAAEGDVEVFVGLNPTRVLDTRIGLGVDEAGPMGPGESITIDVAGVGDIPAEATSVAFNTAYPNGATSNSFLTIWKTGEEQPFTAVNNATPGQVTPNFVISALGDGGRVNVYNDRGNADVVLDVAGYFIPLSEVDMGSTGGDSERLDPPWWPGDAPPAANHGAVGDMYVDLNALEVYGPKTASGWGAGRPIGPDGVGEGGKGTTTLIEAGPPDINVGILGDVYLDTITLNLYGPKTGSGWGTPISLDLLDDLGPTFLTGIGVPLISLGDIGDTYLDTSTLNLFGPKTGGGWGSPVSLDILDDVGSTFLSGTGVPLVSLGELGDMYLDTATLGLYGPKTGGGWGSPVSLIQLPSAATDSALSALGTGETLTISVGDSTVQLPDNGASVGTSVARVDDDTFEFVDAGTYKVSYSVEGIGLSVLGDVEVHINGAQAPNTPAHPLVGLTSGFATGTVLVDVDADDELEIVLTGIATLGVATSNADLTIELVALD